MCALLNVHFMRVLNVSASVLAKANQEIKSWRGAQDDKAEPGHIVLYHCTG